MNDKEEGHRKLAESNYESCNSERYDLQQEKHFLPSEVNVQKASLVRAAMILFTEAGFEPAQSEPSFIQRYLNYVQKSEHNRQLEEAHCSQVQQFGSIYRNCLNTATPARKPVKGGLLKKLHADQEEKKQLVLPFGISKHKLIFSPSVFNKCSARLLLDIQGLLKVLDEVAHLTSYEQAAQVNDVPPIHEDSHPLPCTSRKSGRMMQAQKLSARTKEIRLRMRKTAERIRKDYCNSSGSSDEYE